jgi:integrase
MSEEKKDEKKYRGVFEKVKGSGVWWIRYFADGRKHREKVGKKSHAIKRYQIRKTEIYEGRFFPLHHGPSINTLKEVIFENYRLNNQKIKPLETSWNHLEPVFGGMRAESVTTEKMNRYIADRSTKGSSNATINRDMAMLQRMFRLAARTTPPMVRRIPAFPPRLKEAAPRSGFVVDQQFRALMAQPMEMWLQAFLAVAYKFGFRTGELLSIRVRQVDLAGRIIRLNPGETKNDEGRIAPMTSEIHELLKHCVKGKGPDDFVFTRGKKRVIDFRGAWDIITAAAGVPGLLPHDLRRSAVRNMLRRGIHEKVAMAISGHKTRAVFDRYNIVSETDILDAGRKLEDRKRSDPRRDTGVSRGTNHVSVKRIRMR